MSLDSGLKCCKITYMYLKTSLTWVLDSNRPADMNCIPFTYQFHQFYGINARGFLALQ